MTCSRRVVRTPVDRQCKVEGTVKTTLKVDFEINPIDPKKKKKKNVRRRRGIQSEAASFSFSISFAISFIFLCLTDPISLKCNIVSPLGHCLYALSRFSSLSLSLYLSVDSLPCIVYDWFA
jgi:hypothetical protein